MNDNIDDGLDLATKDEDQATIRLLLSTLKGDAGVLNAEVEANLETCAVTALFYGRRMGLESQDAFDAVAAICLVLGPQRRTFFENIFLDRMMTNPHLTAQEKLNRIVEIVIATIPRPAESDKSDFYAREAG